MEGLRLTWHGHSCFTVDYNGYRLVIDPYVDNMIAGLSKLRLSANEVICTHHHDDHDYIDAVTIVPARIKRPFTVTEVICAHDKQGGTKRGMNTIYILEVDGLRVAHLGDIGCELTEAQLEPLMNLDALMIPVGGFYTIDADEAGALVDRISPIVTIPMHYRSDTFGFSNINTIDRFLELRGNFKHYDSNFIVLNKETEAHVAVLRYIPCI